jgi:hypothetical protein
MSSYFKAAELCGLRANTEGFKRAAHRSIARSSPAALRQETEAVAKREAHDVVTSIGARPPPTDPIEIEDTLLPFAGDRHQHVRQLDESAADIAEREGRDHSDYQQEQKVQAQRLHQLHLELQAERRAEEERMRELAAQEEAVRRSQEETREKLREAYGPCFLWNRVPPEQDVSMSFRSNNVSSENSPSRQRREDVIEKSVDRAMKISPWLLPSNDSSSLVA